MASAEELTAVIACDAGAAPAIDLDHLDLFVVAYTMSPAFGGFDVLDDGTRVTFLSRYRQPCSGEPMPMPMQSFAAFQLPKGEERTFAEAACTLEAACE